MVTQKPASKRTALGKGLGDLIRRTDDLPTAADKPRAQKQPASADIAVVAAARNLSLPDGSRLVEIPLELVVPNPRQPRTHFDEDALAELVESVKEVGVLQPVVVRPAGEGYELIMGERRYRASKAAGKKTIPAVVRATADADLLRDALLENLHRSNLNPLEEAAAYEQLLTDFGCSQEELAKRIQRSRPHISNTIRLLKLPAPVQRRVAAGVLSAGHARALLSLTEPAVIERMAQRIVAEGLSVRQTEEQIALAQRSQDSAPTKTRKLTEPSPRAQEIARQLEDRFDTRVKVHIGRHKGHITIEFAEVEDLDRILGLLQEK